METRLGHLSEVPMVTGLPASWDNPVKPEMFTGKHEGRLAKPLDLTQFGVNYVSLDPGSISSLRHWHEGEDEFVFVLSGELSLIDDNGEHRMVEGSFAAFPAGESNGHHLVNQSAATANLLVIGSRKPGEDVCHYPDEELDRVPG